MFQKAEAFGVTEHIRKVNNQVGPYDDEPEDKYRLMASDGGADAFVSKLVITAELLPAIGDVRRRLSGGSGPLPPSTGGSLASARCRSDGLQPPELQMGGA